MSRSAERECTGSNIYGRRRSPGGLRGTQAQARLARICHYATVSRVNGKLAEAPTPAASTQSRSVAVTRSRAGLLCGLASYVCWGFIPLYFHAVSDVQPVVVLCH